VGNSRVARNRPPDDPEYSKELGILHRLWRRPSTAESTPNYSHSSTGFQRETGASTSSYCWTVESQCLRSSCNWSIQGGCHPVASRSVSPGLRKHHRQLYQYYCWRDSGKLVFLNPQECHWSVVWVYYRSATDAAPVTTHRSWTYCWGSDQSGSQTSRLYCIFPNPQTLVGLWI